MYDILKKRAEFNHRSLSAEVTYLVEVGLSEQNQGTRDLLHFLYRAGGGPTLDLKSSEPSVP